MSASNVNPENFYSRNFTYHVPAQVFKDNTLTINDLKTYMIVRSFTDTTGNVYPSNNWIAKELHIDRRTVITCINRLIEKGYLIKYDIKGKRHLSIKVPSIPQEIIISTDDEKLSTGSDQNVTQLVITRSPPSDHTITPPSDLAITQLDQNIINSKNIKKGDFSKKAVDNFSKFRNPPVEIEKMHEQQWKLRIKHLEEITKNKITGVFEDLSSNQLIG